MNIMTREARREHALAMSKQGWSFDDIGEELGVTPATARSLVQRARTETFDKAFRTIALNIELERIDALWKAFYSRAITGDFAAADILIKLSDQRMKLMGLYGRAKAETLRNGQRADLVSLLAELDM